MKKFLSLSSLATLAIVLGMVSWGSSLNAQNTPSTSPNATPPSQQAPSTQQPQSTQQPPSPEMPPANQQTPSSQTQTPSQSQTPDTTAPQSGSRAGSQSNSDATSRSGQTAGGSQTFTGTVVKQGDKYVLKDDTGKTYDIDHQTDVAKFEGKRVRVQGTLDPSGKIMVK